jgi:hypothetical protein
MPEQRNAYQGIPPRPWIRLVLHGADGRSRELSLLADTGNPCAVIVGSELLAEFNLGLAPGMSTNFGPLDGGWLRVQMPELNFDESILAYGSDVVVQAASASHGDFGGLAGLPLLRMLEYGGNRDYFWIRESSLGSLPGG